MKASITGNLSHEIETSFRSKALIKYGTIKVFLTDALKSNIAYLADAKTKIDKQLMTQETVIEKKTYHRHPCPCPWHNL